MPRAAPQWADAATLLCRHLALLVAQRGCSAYGEPPARLAGVLPLPLVAALLPWTAVAVLSAVLCRRGASCGRTFELSAL